METGWSNSESKSKSTSTETGDNEAHFKVSTIQCDLIYNPISIIIDDDVCARFDHAMNLHINTNLCPRLQLQLQLQLRLPSQMLSSPAIASLALFQGNRNPETPNLAV